MSATFKRVRVAILTVFCALGLVMALMASSASAAPVSLYAYVGGTATSGCDTQSGTVADECSLSTAISVANAAGTATTIYLETPSSTADYQPGPTTLDPTAAVTIEPDTGVAAEIEGTDNAGAPGMTVSSGTVTFSGNTANSGSLTFSGYPGALAVNTGSALATEGTSNVTVEGVTFTDNAVGYLIQALDLGQQSDGGAINDEDSASGTLNVSNSTFTGNSTDGGVASAANDNEDSGGAIYVDGGTAIVSNSEFDDNNDQGLLGAAGDVYNGGAVALASGTLNVTDSTFNANYAEPDLAAVSVGTVAGNGGAIANLGGALTVSTSTFYGNYTNGGAANVGVLATANNGGAVFTYGSASTTTVSQSTFDDNNLKGLLTLGLLGVANEGADFFNATSSTTNVAANIFADSCTNQTALLGGSGTLNDAGYNVGTDASCENGGAHDVSNATDLALGTLGYNGGPTQTIVPGASSDAAGVIPASTSVTLNGASVQLCPTTDQRGIASSGACNAGSVQNGTVIPSNTGGAPTLATPVVEGQAATCSAGGWTPTPSSYTYTWYVSGSVVATDADKTGTTDTYTPTAGQVGDTIYCTVAANDSAGTSSAIQSNSTTVQSNGSVPSNSGAAVSLTTPVVAGDNAVCNAGGWTPAPTDYTYTWYIDSAEVSGATATTTATTDDYAVPAGDVGDTIYCMVSATTDGANYSSPVQSNETTVTAIPVNSGGDPSLDTPVITGQAATCNAGGWSPTPDTYTYTWYVNGSEVTSATTTTSATTAAYTVPAADDGDPIYCEVAATIANVGTSTPVSSNTTTVIAVPSNTTAPTVSTPVTAGSIATCNAGDWTDSPSSYTYTWYVNGVEVTSATTTTSATTATYSVPAADAGDTIYCEVSATNGAGTSNPVQSSNSPTVGGGSPATTAPSNTNPPSITGTPTVGQTLSCNAGTWTGNPTPTYSYQWDANGTPIAGATGSTYNVVSADDGETITCVVTATNSAGTATATSGGVKVPASSKPTNTGKPTITGTVGGGKTVTCNAGTWSGNPAATYSYQWYLDGALIPGATGKSYNIPTSQEGETLTCEVTATNSAGSTTVTTTGVKIPVPHVAHCPAVTGTMNGLTLGKVTLGTSMTTAKAKYKGDKFTKESKGFIVCLKPAGMRVEHPTKGLLKAIPASQRKHWQNRAVLAMTTSTHFSFKGVRPTTLWSTAQKKFHFVAKYLVNGDYYYVIANGKSDVILKVRGRTVYGIGITVAALQKTAAERNAYKTQYWSRP